MHRNLAHMPIHAARVYPGHTAVSAGSDTKKDEPEGK